MRTSRLATLSVVFLLGALAVPSSPAETSRPVKWTLSAETEENLPLRKGATVVAQLRATIDSGWHLYSLDQEPGGPTATKIKVADGQPFKIHGDIDQPTPISALDRNFNLETHFYEREVTFKISLTVATSVKSKQPLLSIDVLYQTCNDTTCLPPTVAHVTAEVKQSND
jgi:DsbC/DsbD-like thiol-disulfide interchange protein